MLFKDIGHINKMILKLKKYELLYNNKEYKNYYTKIFVRINDKDKEKFFKKMNIDKIIDGKKDNIYYDKQFSQNILEYENDKNLEHISLYYVIIQNKNDFDKFCQDFNIKNIKKRGKNYNCYWNCEKPKYYKKNTLFHCIEAKYKKPKYPIYVISKGRYKAYYYTIKNLIAMKIHFHLIVEKNEKKQYEELIIKLNGNEYITILILSSKVIEGSTPARNYAWQHSIDLGYKNIGY